MMLPEISADKSQTMMVGAETKVSALASAIAIALQEDGGTVELQAIGAAAVNAAVKGVAAARHFLKEEGLDCYLLPAFIDVTGRDGESLVAIHFRVNTWDTEQ